MPRPPHLDPGPFFLSGDAGSVLLLHGFGGSPPEMRLIGEYLHARGLAVSAPLLPGHGTTEEDLNRRRWGEWRAAAERALAELQARGGAVYVGGLSMGSVLTLCLAAGHPELAGIVAYSPALMLADWRVRLVPLAKYVLPFFSGGGGSDLAGAGALQHLWYYDRTALYATHELLKLIAHTRRALPRVTCPLLVVHGTRDRAIHPCSAQYTFDHAGSPDKELVTLHNSGHALTVDAEWPDVAERTWRFVQAHSLP